MLKEVVWNFRALEYGKVRFQPEPWLLHVGDSPLPAFQQRKLGISASLTQLDHYRGALEMAASMAMTNMGMADFNPGNREVVLNMINTFIMGRLDVAARIAHRFGNSIAAVEFAKRRLLWATDEAMRKNILDQEQEMVTAATFQAIKELFGATVGATQLVLCAMTDAASVRIKCRTFLPMVPTVVRDLPTALEAEDRDTCLYLTDTDEIGQALHAAGVAYGSVMALPELVHMFRISA